MGECLASECEVIAKTKNLRIKHYSRLLRQL